MSSTLLSPSWYLVSELKVSLRSHVQISRHVYRGRVWYILKDSLGAQYHRISTDSYSILGLLNGKRTLSDVWNILVERCEEELPTQDDIIFLLSKLYRSNLLFCENKGDFFEFYQRKKNHRVNQIFQKIKSPMGIKIPLFDPDVFLNKTIRFVSILFSRFGWLLWFTIVIIALVQAALHWSQLTTNVSDRILSLGNVFLLALIYPFVKVIHELGHAYTVKRWGGEVHEVGVMLLVFFPVPYVDASSATIFSNKYQRMLVGASGVMVEVFIASIAMIIWTMVEPGVVRALAFNTMMIAGVSTVFFNGNPLLRFDAYYVLADYLEIPNLASRSNQYVAYIVKRYFLGIKGLERISFSLSESLWLFFYAVFAFVYRMVIMIVIALFVASEYFIIGVILALWSIYLGLFSPMLKIIHAGFFSHQLKNKRTRIRLYFCGFLVSLGLIFCVIPMPYTTYAQGVFWVDDNAHVRVDSHGFMDRQMVTDGSWVKQGQALIQLRSIEKIARLEELTGALKESEIKLRAGIHDKVSLESHQELVVYSRKERERAQKNVNSLVLRSPTEGIFVLAKPENRMNHYVTRGESIGFVVDFSRLPVTVLVSQDHISEVRDNIERIDVRLSSDLSSVHRAYIKHIYPSSTKLVPSQILTVEGGGDIVVDPQYTDELRAFDPHFKLIIDIPSKEASRLNERVHILFRHKSEPLAYRFLRSVRREFLRRLDV